LRCPYRNSFQQVSRGIPKESDDVLGNKIALAKTIKSLKGGVGLEDLKLAEVLPCKFKLELLDPSQGEKLLQLLLRRNGYFLSLHVEVLNGNSRPCFESVKFNNLKFISDLTSYCYNFEMSLLLSDLTLSY
jgi:hypothetical protein